jgi:hypothetical protein
VELSSEDAAFLGQGPENRTFLPPTLHGCPVRVNINHSSLRGAPYWVACQLEAGHRGVCKNLAGEAITMVEIPPDTREALMRAIYG